MNRLKWHIGSGRILGLMVAAVLAAAVSSIPVLIDASTRSTGIGNLGLTGGTATGGGSSASTSLNPTFMVSPTAGQALSVVRNNLVAAINVDANYIATAVTDPDDPNSNSFTVARAGGGDVPHMSVCETDSNIDNVGVSFSEGRDVAQLNKVTAVAANGDYVLSISTWDHGTTTQTFNTTVVPNNTPAGLTASIIAGFTAAGFSVVDDGLNLNFRRSADKITALRVSSSDTGVNNFCVDLNFGTSAGIPTASEVGMFLLAIMLIGSAMWMLHRSSKGGVARP